MKYFHSFGVNEQAINDGPDTHESYMLDYTKTRDRDIPHTSQIFKTTGMLWLSHDQSIMQVSRIMFDSGVSAVFVSRRLVEMGNLRPYKLANPAKFTMSNGKFSMFSKVVDIELSIAGVVNKITAFVDKGDSPYNILLGQAGLEAFLAHTQNGVGGSRKKYNKVTVAQDIKGMRVKRYVVVPDEDRKPVLIRHRTQATLHDKRWLGRSKMEIEMLQRLPAGCCGEDWIGSGNFGG